MKNIREIRDKVFGDVNLVMEYKILDDVYYKVLSSVGRDLKHFLREGIKYKIQNKLEIIRFL